MENKEYYLCSSQVVKQLPELEKSKPFKSGYDYDKKEDYYVISTNNFNAISDAYDSSKKQDSFWCYQIIDSQVSLEYEDYDCDEEGNETHSSNELSIDDLKSEGIFSGIEQYLDISKQENIAYVFYKLSEEYNVNPIELVDLLLED